MENDYPHAMLLAAARACLKYGFTRETAVIEFTKAVELAERTPESRRPPAITLEAIVAAGLRKCGQKK